MSDEVNAQECAIQLARVCGRLIRNARLLAELESNRASSRWLGIPIRHIGGKESPCDYGQLLAMLTTEWKIDVDRLVHSDSADSGSLPSSQVATNLNEAMVDFNAARHELKRLMPNANDVFDVPTILKLREPRKYPKFGNVQRTTMTEAVLDFSNETFEKHDVPLMTAIHELGQIPEPEGKVVERQICREFRSVVLDAGTEPGELHTTAVEPDEMLRQVSNLADAASASEPAGDSSTTAETDGEQHSEPRILPSRAPATASGQTSSDPPDLPVDFVFRPDGDGYFISAFGESGHFGDLLGFRDLYRLVQTPDVAVGMSLLAGEAKAESISKDDTITPADLKVVEKAVKGLLADLAATESDMERKELQSEIDKHTEFLKKNTGLRGRSRDLNATHQTGLRSKIIDRIKTAIAKLRAASPPMPKTADHFYGTERRIHAKGESYVYSPGSDAPAWKTAPEQPA